jgi:hypothetical protein
MTDEERAKIEAIVARLKEKMEEHKALLLRLTEAVDRLEKKQR